MVIFHNFVSLPEANRCCLYTIDHPLTEGKMVGEKPQIDMESTGNPPI
jgi:hypothetical protein